VISITFFNQNIMETTLKVGKKIIHSDWTIMQTYFEKDGTFKLVLADKHSDDQIRFQLQKEDVERLIKTLSNPF
jgi:hypothetical protein